MPRGRAESSLCAGKTTPDCAELVQMCDEMATESGLSKAPRETARYSGQRSNVNEIVDPHWGQKWT
jgi:hypothetical protein